jgi:hypothetical protein
VNGELQVLGDRARHLTRLGAWHRAFSAGLVRDETAGGACMPTSFIHRGDHLRRGPLGRDRARRSNGALPRASFGRGSRAHELHPLADLAIACARRPAGPRGETRRVRAWLAPRRRERRGERRVCAPACGSRMRGSLRQASDVVGVARAWRVVGVACVASARLASFVCSRLPSVLPGAFAEASSRTASFKCSVTVLVTSRGSGHGIERPVLGSLVRRGAGCRDVDARMPRGSSTDAITSAPRTSGATTLADRTGRSHERRSVADRVPTSFIRSRISPSRVRGVRQVRGERPDA